MRPARLKPPANQESPHEGATTPFATTQWNLVLTARDGFGTIAQEALEALCRNYWFPLYAYVRSRGYKPEDAQDLTQAFFAHLLSKDFLHQITQSKGRFRSFLLTCLSHFLSDEWEKLRAEKRGGGREPCSLDIPWAEAHIALDPPNARGPDLIFERQWALTVLNRVLNALRLEFASAGKSQVFDRLQPFLVGDSLGDTYSQSALSLGTTEGAVKMAVHRMRQRYRELFQQELAQTLGAADEVEAEMRYLFAVLSR